MRCRSVLIGLLGLALTLGPFAPAASARLVVVGPDDLVWAADTVAVGTVESRGVTEFGKVPGQEVTLRVDQVLKGSVAGGTLRAAAYEGFMPGVTGTADVFPAVGTQVFLALSSPGATNPGFYGLASQMNAVAIIRDGHVAALYKGGGWSIGQQTWTVADYVRGYDAFYQSHRPTTPDWGHKPVAVAVAKPWWDTVGAWFATSAQRIVAWVRAKV